MATLAPNKDIMDDWILLDPTSDPRGALAKTGSYVESVVDNQVQDFVQNIAKEASNIVSHKIHDLLYLDSDRYGVAADGSPVRIYTRRSQAVDNLFKQATGKGLSEHLQSLPPGINWAAQFTQKKIEERIVSHVLDNLSHLAIGQSVELALMQAYGCGKAYGKNYVAQLVGQGPRAATKTLTTDTAPDLTLVQSEAAPKTEAGSDITADDVITHYENQIIEYVNAKLREILIEAITTASFQISKKGAGAMLDKAQALAYTSSILSAYLPAASVVSAGTGLLLGQYKDGLSETVGQFNGTLANKAAKKYLPQYLMAPKTERTRTHEKEDVNGIEFDLLDEPATFGNWARQKAKAAKREASIFLDIAGKFFDDMNGHIEDDESYDEPANPTTPSNSSPGLLSWMWGSSTSDAKKTTSTQPETVAAPESQSKKKSSWWPSW